MKTWASTYAAFGILAAVVVFSAFIVGVMTEDLKLGTDSLQTFATNDTVSTAICIAGWLIIASGAAAMMIGIRTGRSWASVYGITLMIAGLMLYLYEPQEALLWDDGMLYLDVLFMVVAIAAVALQVADKNYALAIVNVIMLFVIDVAYVLGDDVLKGVFFYFAIAIALLVFSTLAVAGEKMAASRKDREAAEMQAAAEKAAEEQAAKDKAASERQAELEKDLAERRAEREKAAAEERAKQEAAAAAAEKKAAEEQARQEAAAREAEEKRVAEEQAAREAAEKAAAEEAARAEAEKKAAEEQARQEAAAREAEEKRVAEEQAAREAAEKAAAEEAARAEVAPATVVVAAGEGPAEEPAAAESGDDIPDLTLEDIGIEEATPVIFVRRACWNKGLRCRRDYGPMRVPVAFVKGKVAVFVDADKADTSKDAALEKDGWTVFHYLEADITDGEAQAAEIAAAVKENIRSEKAAKAKASKKKSTKKKN